MNTIKTYDEFVNEGKIKEKLASMKDNLQKKLKNNLDEFKDSLKKQHEQIKNGFKNVKLSKEKVEKIESKYEAIDPLLKDWSKDNNDNKKILVLQKTNLSLNPNDINYLYYYIPDKEGKDARELWNSLGKKYKHAVAYTFSIKNPKYNPNAFDDGTDKKTGEKIKDFTWDMCCRKIDINYYLEDNFGKRDFMYKCLLNDDGTERTKPLQPKYCKTLDELDNVLKKLEELYKEHQAESDKFIWDTPLDKIDDFKWTFTPDRMNEV